MQKAGDLPCAYTFDRRVILGASPQRQLLFQPMRGSAATMLSSLSIQPRLKAVLRLRAELSCLWHAAILTGVVLASSRKRDQTMCLALKLFSLAQAAGAAPFPAARNGAAGGINIDSRKMIMGAQLDDNADHRDNAARRGSVGR